jgi:hypothetical protein
MPIDVDGDGTVTVGPDGRVLHTPLAIWSDGPNGINEYGDGDDIIVF